MHHFSTSFVTSYIRLAIWLLTDQSIYRFQDKKSLNLGPDDSLHLEGFALNVFAKADKQDHAGRADLYGTESMIFLHIE